MSLQASHSPSASPGSPRRAPQRLWVTSALFFCQFFAVGVYFTFLNVYLRAMGLSGSEIGLIGTLSGILSMIGTFGWGYLADRTGNPRLLIAIGAIGAFLAAQLMQLVPQFGLEPAVWYFAAISALVGLLWSAVNTLIDSTAVAMLGDQRQKYGIYRLGGSFGYIIGGTASGFLYDWGGYGLMFPAFAVVMSVFAALALLLPARVSRLVGSGQQELGRMIRQREWLILMISLLLFWVGFHMSFVFGGVILKEMGASDQLIAIASVIGSVVELPFMAFSARLLKRFGAPRLFIAGLLMQTLRFFLLAQMRVPEWAIVINMLNGPGYVLLWNSAVDLVARLAPPGLGATSQGFMTSALNLASILSAAVSGVIYDQLGYVGLYYIVGALSLGALIVFGVGLIRRDPQPIEA